MNIAPKSQRPTASASLDELAAWVIANNNGTFDEGEFPATDNLDDDDAKAAREEYEAMADEIENAAKESHS